MVRLFRHYIPTPVLLLGAVEALFVFACADIAWRVRLLQYGSDDTGVVARLPEMGLFCAVVGCVFIAVGMYQTEAYQSMRLALKRLGVALGVSFVLLSVVFYLVPHFITWRSVLLYALVLVAAVIPLLRLVFERSLGTRFKRRIIVMGAGRRAERIRKLSQRRDAGFEPCAFLRMAEDENMLDHAVLRDQIPSLADFVQQHNAEEIVIAMDERRGSLPVSSLLEVKLQGVRVSDLSTFLERETSRVDLETLNPSWLILSDGFWASHRFAVLTKRVFDIATALLLLVASAPILLIAAIAVKLSSPGPVFYRQERVGQFGKTFQVLKFRSMRADAEKDGRPQWAQAGDPRVTAVGRVIRSTRIDEIPQIFNVLFGDMSFVGPRPERPFFVEQLAQQIPYFNERHIVKPGITGWAQLNYSYGASVEDARVKLEYDLYYVKNYSVFLDVLIILQTFRVVIWQDGVR